MIISFGISLGLALIRPVISSMISYYSEESSSGKITGIEEFIARFGEVFGALFFGVLSITFGMGNSFIIIGV